MEAVDTIVLILLVATAVHASMDILLMAINMVVHVS